MASHVFPSGYSLLKSVPLAQYFVFIFMVIFALIFSFVCFVVTRSVPLFFAFNALTVLVAKCVVKVVISVVLFA